MTLLFTKSPFLRPPRSGLFLVAFLVYISSCYGQEESAGDTVSGKVAPDLTRPDIIDAKVLVSNQDVEEKEAGEGLCRRGGLIYRHGQLLKTTLTCYKVLCSNGRLSWVPDQACCVATKGLMPPNTRETTTDQCQLRVCSEGRWTLQPDYERCCQHERKWYPVGSSRPMQGGPCTYHLCHNGAWEAHYNTTCCFDEVGWHTTGTVLFTGDPCRTKTCRNAVWSERDTCCKDPKSGAMIATGDMMPVDGCKYWLCQETKWLTRTAFSCCERHGKRYEHGSIVNVGGSVCGRDRCVDGSWHVIRRQKVRKERCRAGWGRLGPRCVITTSAFTWHQAEEWCGTKGGKLFTIHNKEGWREIEKAGNVSMWLGLRGHETQADLYQWRWVDGTPLTSYVMWGRHHPQRLPGHVCAYVQSGRAYSAPCDDKHKAYCFTTDCEA